MQTGSTSNLESFEGRRFEDGDLVADRYEIRALLGRGGMGEVYRALDRRLSREVALKALPQQRSLDTKASRRFEREVNVTASLSHPNVMALFDVLSHEDILVAVMELLTGRTLETFLEDAGSSPEFLREVASGVASALDAAHRLGIVHRDIKPANIMILDDNRVKVLDFGIARRVVLPGDDRVTRPLEITQPGILAGTIAYMSPEQARGESVGPESDIFSLGIVLYELATGRHPFRSEVALETLRLIAAGEPIAPSRLCPDFSPDLEQLILRMLETDPGLRPKAADVTSRVRATTEEAASVHEGISSGSRRGDDALTVGRGRQLAELQGALQSAREGRGLLVSVTGEAGMGKTTVVEQFLREVRLGSQPCIVAKGACSERLAGSDGYLPILEALESMLRSVGKEEVWRLLRDVALSWFPLVATDSAARTLGDSQLAEARAASQERRKRELVLFFEELTRLFPTVLFLDDLQWVDVSTADLLSHIGRKCQSLRLLVVVSYRPSELAMQNHPFQKAKLELQSRGLSNELSVDGLSTHDLDEYLRIRYAGHAFPESLAELVYSRTEGQPLFLVDLMGFLESCGVIAEQEGVWRVAEAVPDLQKEIPESTRSMIEKKIEQVTDDDRRQLIAASVQGHEFHAAVVARALELDEADVEERLEELDRVHALVTKLGEEELPDDTLTVRYRFAHALYQNTFYDMLTPARRARLSASVAATLVGCHSTKVDEIALELALLYEGARDFRAAADQFLLAAKAAGSRFANPEAELLAKSSIENAEHLKAEDRYQRVLDAVFYLTQIYERVARFEDSLQAFALAEDVAVQKVDVEARVEAICGQGVCLFYMKELERCREEALRALEIARAASSEVGVAQAESTLALERVCQGDVDTAEELFDRAIPVIRSQGQPGYAMNAVGFRMVIHGWRLEYDAIDRGAAWWLGRSRELNVNVVPMHFWHGMALGNQGRISEALALVNEGRRLAELNDDPYHVSRLPNVEGWLRRELQDHEAAIRLDEESVQLGRDLGFEEAEANARVNVAGGLITLGEFGQAWEHLTEASRLFDEDNWFRWRYKIRLHAEFAAYHKALGDLGCARREAETSLELARASTARKHIAWAHKLLGDLHSLEDAVDDAAREYARALDTLVRHPCPTIEWKILVAAADLARLRRNSREESDFRDRARRIIESIVAKLGDDALREGFLASERVREISTG